jgi:4-hydroxy-tetrahydrodipicolinate reductase
MKIALLGYGKMGRTIERLALHQGHEIVLKIAGDNAQDLTPEALQKADVAIDFSQPETAFSNIQFCLKNQLPVVSGTTGWLKDMDQARQFCEEQGGAFFYAANFSIGVNLFFALNRHLAELMEPWSDYDPGVTETHHRHKLDYPSGTGLVIAEDIVEGLSRKLKWVEGPAGSLSELGLSSQRFGQVPGTHEVNYDSAEDTITIRHTARSRDGFAKGAILAAQWLIGKKGYFGMEDMLFPAEPV